MLRPLLRPLVFLSLLATAAAQSTLVLTPPAGVAAKNKHVVLLSGDEEYRSEEALPMLAKILSQRHGFKTTVLFALDPDGTINPENQKSLAGAEALDSADVIIMALRFRQWPDDQMQRFVNAFNRGVPIIALRTSTHPFNFPADSKWSHYTWNQKEGRWPGGFGKNVLGETWVTHWGRHKVEATRGVIEPSAKNDPILRGVEEVFGDSDVYEAYPPADAKILMRGLVLKGMKPADAPADYAKPRATDKQPQPVNDPAMPVVWTRTHRNEAGKENKVLTTTLGAATDLENEGLRRLVVNGVYWALSLNVPAKADVRLVDPYTPLMYGFRGYRVGLKPSDYALGKTVPEGGRHPPPAPKKKQADAPKKTAEVERVVPNALASTANALPNQRVGDNALHLKPPLQLNAGDHIAIIGNALADRMQHHGWLETMIHVKHPHHRLVVRNLAVAGDEIATRARSKDFGTPDEWLTRVQAGVIFAFFGFNESFAGREGLAKFKSDLQQFLRDTRAKNYNGLAAPQIVLFSPIANEKHPDPNFAIPAENNANLALYTATMAEVARDRAGVTFVDLFSVSHQLFAEAAASRDPPLTINGVHLSAGGEAKLAAKIFPALFGEPAPTDNAKLRAAINEKNAIWHSRYRTVDGYNVYGGRSQLAFPATPEKDGPKIKNFDVMQQEMAQRDVMTANRDQRVWAVAAGGDLAINDSNLPPVTPVPTNKPGKKPDGSHDFVSGEEAIAKMKVHEGLKVNLFASEEQFPELAKPVQMAWDTRGRLWVAVWPSYPERTPTAPGGDSLLVFEDTDGDGRADKMTKFLTDLNCPTGFQFYKDGVLVMQAPDLWFVRDTDGDGKADWKERVLMGLDSADSHHTTNSVVYEPGGALLLSDGVFHRTQVETATGVVRNIDGAIYRYEPSTAKFETYVSFGFANPHGRTFDRWGNDLIVDATSNRTYFGPAFSGRLDYPAKHPRMKEFWMRPARPSADSTIITSRHLPDEFWGNFINGNVIGFQGYYRVKIVDDGSGLRGERLPDLISSSDPNFRPVALSVGPDGAVYFLDWHNAIIGHMQHHIRDPNRDHVHGRIYRITAEGRPLVRQPKIHGQSIAALLELLKACEDHVRTLAKIELNKHDSKAVIAATWAWVSRLDNNRSPARERREGRPRDSEVLPPLTQRATTELPPDDHDHHLTEALWVHQWHNVVDADLLQRLLLSADPNARAAATRVLCYWRDRVPNALALLKVQAADEHPRVRLHAVRAASFFRSEEAVDVALSALKQPLDYYLDYTLTETVKQLKPYWRNVLGGANTFAANDPARVGFLLRTVSNSELLKMPKSTDVLEQLVKRTGISDSVRAESLVALAKIRHTTGARILTDLLDTGIDIDAANVGKLLAAQPRRDLQAIRPTLQTLVHDDTVEARSHCWAAMVVADGSIDAAWKEAEKQTHPLTTFLFGIALVPDAALRASAYPRIVPLLERAPTTATMTADAAAALQRAAIRAAVSTRQEPAAQFQKLVQLIQRGEEVAAAAQGLRSLPREAWADAEIGATINALIAWARKTPVSVRRDRDYLTTVQTTEELIARLPATAAMPLQKQLGTLRVAAFLLRAVPEQMRYDITRIVVEPGRPFQIIFENTDVMPHNLVIVKPGSRERVGNAALLLPPEHLDRQDRAYVPESLDVIAATKMLEAGQSEMLRLNAPTTEGIYEYVCTFPGHWTVMYGQLIVSKDPDAYRDAKVAGAAPATAPAPAVVHQHGH